MSVPIIGNNGTTNLQATLSAATSMQTDSVTVLQPHHPITCHGDLFFDDNGVFSCTHATCPAGDPRTQAALNHSFAMLIIELASKL